MTRGRRGSALLVVLMAMLLLSAFGLALILSATADSMASGNVKQARVMLYAADAGLERSLADLQRTPDWDAVLAGAVTSGFTDGQPSGERTLEDGRKLSIDEVVNLANCGNASPCEEAAMNAATEERPWGLDNPRWHAYAWGRVASLSGGMPDSGYLLILVGDDPLDADGEPMRDGRGDSPGRGVLLLRAHAFGRGGASRVIEATVARDVPWSEGEGYTGQRGKAVAGDRPVAAVQVPGAGLGQVEMSLR